MFTFDSTNKKSKKNLIINGTFFLNVNGFEYLGLPLRKREYSFLFYKLLLSDKVYRREMEKSRAKLLLVISSWLLTCGIKSSVN